MLKVGTHAHFAALRLVRSLGGCLHRHPAEAHLHSPYTLLWFRHQVGEIMRVLGIDPGRRQTWYAVLRCDQEKTSLVGVGYLDLHPDMPLDLGRPALVSQTLADTLTQWDPDLVAVERFIIRRGKGGGNVTEPVNQFIGMLARICHVRKIPCRYIMPGTHKQWWKHTFLEEAATYYNVTVHAGDAIQLALYAHDTLTTWLDALYKQEKKKGKGHHYEFSSPGARQPRRI